MKHELFYHMRGKRYPTLPDILITLFHIIGILYTITMVVCAIMSQEKSLFALIIFLIMSLVLIYSLIDYWKDRKNTRKYYMFVSQRGIFIRQEDTMDLLWSDIERITMNWGGMHIYCKPKENEEEQNTEEEGKPIYIDFDDFKIDKKDLCVEMMRYNPSLELEHPVWDSPLDNFYHTKHDVQNAKELKSLGISQEKISRIIHLPEKEIEKL